MYRERKEPRLVLARATLAVTLEGEERIQLEPLSKLPRHLQVKLLTDIFPNISGTQRKCLSDLSRQMGLTAWAEARCRSRFWWRRHHGSRQLTVLGGGELVVPALFLDRHPNVQAQAAEWSSDHPNPEVISNLLALLSDSSALCRFAAQDSVLSMGHSVIEPLAPVLSKLYGQSLQLALEIATGLASPKFLPTALARVNDNDAGVRVRVAHLLGAIGGPEALVAANGLLNDTDPKVRARAATAMGKLGDWSKAPVLASMLADSIWEVRLAAGLALGALGGPGMLFLRHSLVDHDPLVADIARQMLDVQSNIQADAA